MADFEIAMKKIFSNEGGECVDRGGHTNMGITQPTLNTAIDQGIVPRETSISGMTHDKAMKIYRALYWNPLHLDEFNDQELANRVFDMGVNAGIHTAAILLQRSILSALGIKIDQDGQIGKTTLACINNLHDGCPKEAIVSSYKSERAGYYRCLKDPINEKGWLNRAYS